MSVQFLKALAERALKTFCQTLVLALGSGATNLLDVGWMQALSVAGLAALLSVLTSIGSAQLRGDPDSPSLVAGDR